MDVTGGVVHDKEKATSSNEASLLLDVIRQARPQLLPRLCPTLNPGTLGRHLHHSLGNARLVRCLRSCLQVGTLFAMRLVKQCPWAHHNLTAKQ